MSVQHQALNAVALQKYCTQCCLGGGALQVFDKFLPS